MKRTLPYVRSWPRRAQPQMGCYGASLAILAGVGCNVRVNPLDERVQSSFETCIESVAGAPQRNLWRRKWEEMILVVVEVV